MNKQIVLLCFCTFYLSISFCNAQTLSLTLDDVLFLSSNSNESGRLRSDSVIMQYQDRLFKIKTLPIVDLTATLPNLNNSISPIIQSDGSEKYINRFTSNTSATLRISQLLPFTGGTVAFYSSLNRLDNFSPEKNTTYNLNLINLSYSQKITTYNEYKWDKRLFLLKKSLDNIKLVQRKEIIKQQAIELFFNLYAEQSKSILNNTILELSDFFYSKAKILYSEQRISEEDLIDAEIEYNRAVNMNNTWHLSKAQDDLNAFLNIPSRTESIITFDPKCIDKYSFNFDINHIINNVLEYTTTVSYNYEKLEREKALKSMQSNTGPVITISVGAGVNSQSEYFTQLMKENQSNRTNIMLSLSMPILNWGENKLHRNILSEQIYQIDLQTDTKVADATSATKYELNYLLSLKNEIIQDRQLIELLNRKLEVMKISLEYGRVDMGKYIQAKRQLIQSELSYNGKIKNLFMIIFKYRYLSLIDIRDNSAIVSFSDE